MGYCVTYLGYWVKIFLLDRKEGVDGYWLYFIFIFGSEFKVIYIVVLVFVFLMYKFCIGRINYGN